MTSIAESCFRRLLPRLGGFLMAGLLLLASCDLPGGVRREITILDGQITVRAPQFYCVDRQASRAGKDTAVVLIGRCAVKDHVAAAVVTVTVGGAASGGVMLAGAEALRQFLRSSDGRKVLSRSGRVEDVAVLQSGVVDGTLMLHLNDALAGEYWRAIIGLRGRLVTVSALGPEVAPLPPEHGRHLVEQTVAALNKANPAAQGG
ncbi:MAG: hypothetical protein WCS20_07880 [Alphaproteobacteria bacterium]